MEECATDDVIEEGFISRDQLVSGDPFQRIGGHFTSISIYVKFTDKFVTLTMSHKRELKGFISFILLARI